jgi:hypothetical protein
MIKGSETPRTDALMRQWSDDGATRGPAFIELRNLARQLERDLAALRKEMHEMDRDFQRESREIAAEERWKATQGDEYGSY